MAGEIDNPFPVSGYHGPSLFCNRKDETEQLQKNVKNGVNTTLFSLRRMGKTGLIRHLFHKMRTDNLTCIYIDIYATQNLREFTNQLGSAVLKAFPERQSAGKKLMKFIRLLRPVISYDALTGDPQVSFDFSQPKQYEHSLESIFSFLDNQKRTLIAFDEFQQITFYPESNTEALLRTCIQPLSRVNFIFSGSSRHLLGEIFSQTKRPFFSSTRPLNLNAISKYDYGNFIRNKFSLHRRKISEEGLEFIMDWSRLHTYYTQFICNRLFSSGKKMIDIDFIRSECDHILKEQESIFYQYRSLLTSLQWKLLEAIALERSVNKPQSRNFLEKYDIGTSSNVQKTLEALLQKEMIYKEYFDHGVSYSVYDCFLSRWFERKAGVI